MDRARQNDAWDIVRCVRARARRAGPVREAHPTVVGGHRGPVAVFVFTGYSWGSVATAVLLAVGCCFTCYYFNTAPPEQELLPVAALHVAVPVGQPRQQEGQVNGGGGLSQEDVEAILVFEYRRKAGAASEQCAICINVVRDGETVRRLPACGHAFHASCVDGWLRVHATCLMCCVDVKVAAGPTVEPAV